MRRRPATARPRPARISAHGVFQVEVVREGCEVQGTPFRGHRPVRTLGDLEEITSAWVAWYNHERLMRRLGLKPPAEVEAAYWAGQHAPGSRVA
jgi:putative transposase